MMLQTPKCEGKEKKHPQPHKREKEKNLRTFGSLLSDNNSEGLEFPSNSSALSAAPPPSGVESTFIAEAGHTFCTCESFVDRCEAITSSAQELGGTRHGEFGS